MNSSTGTIAGIGSTDESSGNSPRKQSRQIATPVASEIGALGYEGPSDGRSHHSSSASADAAASTAWSAGS